MCVGGSLLGKEGGEGMCFVSCLQGKTTIP